MLKSFRVELFFDVGANVGIYSWIAKSEGVKEIFLWEPDLTNQRLLSDTIRRNSTNSCFLFPFAMSSEVGIANFLIDDASGTTGSLVDDTKNSSSLHSSYGLSKYRSVPTLKLDIFCEYALNKRTLLKIDVEGAEQLIFDGGREFLKQIKPIIQIECFERSRLECIEELGYDVKDLSENHNYLLTPRGFAL